MIWPLLSSKHQELLDGIDMYVEEKAGKTKLDREDIVFTRGEVARFLKWPHHHVRDYIPMLVEMEYLTQIGSTRGSTFRYCRNYNMTKQSDPIAWLMSPQELKNKVEAQNNNKDTQKTHVT